MELICLSGNAQHRNGGVGIGNAARAVWSRRMVLVAQECVLPAHRRRLMQRVDGRNVRSFLPVDALIAARVRRAVHAALRIFAARDVPHLAEPAYVGAAE